jgi:alpha-N-arabinofuranosidase
VSEVYQLSGDDPKAGNTWEAPNAVMPKKLGRLKLADGKLRLRLPPLSFTTLSFNR